MTDGDIEKTRREIDRIRREDVPRAIQSYTDRAEAYRAYVNEQTKVLEQQSKQMLESLITKSDPQNDISNPRDIGIIFRRTDGFGNVFFTRHGLSQAQLNPEQLRVLRNRIVSQRYAFNRLPEEERVKLSEEFESSKGKAEIPKPFAEYLRSEELGKRFAKLRQGRQNP